MSRISGRFLAAIVMAAPLLYAAPAHAGGAGNCGGSVLGLAGTETCGAYKNDASDATNPNDLHGFTVSSGGDLVFRNGVGLSGLEHMRLTATGSLGLGSATPKASVDFGSKTDALLLQTGTTGQRPATPSAGMVRYNSTTPAIEAYVSNTWAPVALSACDNVAAYPIFADQTGLTVSTLTSSNIVAITGLDSGCNVTVGVSGTGGSPEYRVCSDAACSSVVQTWGSANTSFDMYGKYLQLRATSSASVATAYTITVSIGPLDANWIISTGVSGCSPEGTVCADGTIYAGLSGASTAMYTTRCDLGQSWNGSSCAGSRLSYSWNNGNTTGYTTTSQTGTTDGKTYTANLITIDSDSITGGVQQHKAAQACADLVDSGYSDWYLPAKTELNTLYTSKTAIGNFNTGGSWYWSSSETGANDAWHQRFSDGLQNYSGTENRKEQAYYVRCARTDGSSTSGSGTNTSGVPLGTLASNTSPYKPGDTTTGLYSDATGTVQIATSSTERLRVTATGSVGIGTTTPQQALDVSGSVRGSTFIPTSSSAPTNGLYLPATNTLGFATNSGNVMNVTATGSLGLGTTTPKVSVDFGSKTDALLLQTGTTGQRPATPSAGMIRYNSTTPAIEAYVSNAWSSLGGGSSTLGTSAGAASPYKTGEVGTGLFSSSASTVSIATGATERLRVTATGSVGLGTTTPKSSLDLSANTDGLVLQTASAAANASCTASLTGAIRYNSNLTNIEFCTGSAWSRVVLSTCDNSPAIPNFGDVTNLATSQLTSSSIAQITGMDSGCTVTVGVSGTGGSPEYRVCSDSGCSSVTQDWTNANNSIDIQGKYMQLRATSSASVSTAYTITATIGPVSATWIMSTGMSGCSPAGTVCSDGTVYAGLSGASTPMYVTPCDAGQSWSGSACTGTRLTKTWNAGNAAGHVSVSTSTADGQANTTTLIATDSDSITSGTQQHVAAQYCADLTFGGQSDWYLPSTSELATIFANKTAIGGFSTSYYYTSTQKTTTEAYYIIFNTDPTAWWMDKSNGYYVRCARR